MTESNTDTELLIEEIEARDIVMDGWHEPTVILTPDERDSLIATVKQLRGMVYLPKILADDDDVTYERLSGRLLREKIDLQSQLEQLRAELAQSYADNERLALVLQGIEERETTKQGPETQPRAGNPWTGNEP